MKKYLGKLYESLQQAWPNSGYQWTKYLSKYIQYSRSQYFQSQMQKPGTIEGCPGKILQMKVAWIRNVCKTCQFRKQVPYLPTIYQILLRNQFKKSHLFSGGKPGKRWRSAWGNQHVLEMYGIIYQLRKHQGTVWYWQPLDQSKESLVKGNMSRFLQRQDFLIFK